MALAQLLAFNTLEVIGSAENNNFPAIINYGSGDAGAKCRRPQYEMKFTATDSTTVYDNNGYFTTDTFGLFEMFKVPKVDLSGLGNGDPLYTKSGAVPILVKNAVIKVTLQEGNSSQSCIHSCGIHLTLRFYVAFSTLGISILSELFSL